MKDAPRPLLNLDEALEQREPGVPTIVLETAQPAKFAATIREAIGPGAPAPELPPALAGIETLPRRFSVLPADTGAVMRYIESHAA